MTVKEARLERAILRLTRYARHASDCALSNIEDIAPNICPELCTCGLSGAKSEFSEAFVEAEFETRERLLRAPE